MGHSQSTPSTQGTNPTLPQPLPISSGRVFNYTPLAHPRNFRILHLTRKMRHLRKDWQELPLQGTLVEASLDNVPEYFALSYYWGNPVFCEKISINGRVLAITQNCADALRRMLKGKAERMIWVDSICINQSSDPQALQERGKQVALMDEIYSKATQVNVHLGPGDEKSVVAVAAVNRLWPASLAAKTAVWNGAPQEEQEATRRKYDEVAAEVLNCSLEFPYGQLHGLFRLPWFRRTWVVQEVALAQNVMFYCGERLLHFENLAAAADFTRVPYSNLDAAARHWKLYLDWHHALAEFIRRRKNGEDIKIDLEVILVGTLILEASRPVDKVFGLYGCAKRLGLELPVPDYTKSVAQVYTEATLACFRQDGNLKMLERTEGTAANEFELPSWVPDFSANGTKWSSESPPNINTMSTMNTLVSGKSQCQWTIMPDGRRLKVLGRRLDHVAAVGAPWRADSRTTLYGNAERNTGQFAGSLMACIETWLDIVRQRNHGQGSSAAVQDLTSLLINGHPRLTEPPERIAKCLSVLVNCARSSDETLRSLLILPEDNMMAIHQYSEFYLSQSMVTMIADIAFSMWKQVFRTTSKAYLGIGTYSSRPGDLIVVFHGMAVPCIIRPCEGGFNFVSAAFVDGITHGEFWDAGSDQDDEWFMLI